MDQREVRAAWHKFVERGALSADLRSSVAASWQRSRNHRVTIDRARAPLVEDAELFRRRSKHASLRHAARLALDGLAQREGLSQLHRALDALPTELRECLVLRELEEMSYRDIAQVWVSEFDLPKFDAKSIQRMLARTDA